MQADQRWDEISIAGQIYIKMNEGLKKLIGFNEKGNNNSYWIKIMGKYVQNDSELFVEYTKIKDDLIVYASNKKIQDYIQSIRSISVHGDENLDSFTQFKILNEVDIDFTFNLLLTWGNLLKRTSLFIDNCH